MQTIGVLGAMPEEVDLIFQALTDPREEEYGGVLYKTGTCHTLRVVAACAGMGKVNAASTTQVLITRYGVDAVLVSGVAGNMSAQLRVGDIVISSDLVYHDAEDRMLRQSAPGTAVYSATPTLIAAAGQACTQVGARYLIGRIATGDQFIGDFATKKKIREKTAPLCVDMEGAAVAHVAMRNKIPFVVIRAISDNAEESIESLGAESFDVSAYTKTASAIILKSLQLLSAAE